jgi:hypothetical protein
LFKLTDISYRLRFSFALFACIIRSFFVFHSFAFRSCNWFVRFVYRSFRSSIWLDERTKRNMNEGYTKRTNERCTKRTNERYTKRTNQRYTKRTNQRYTIHETNARFTRSRDTYK